MIRPTVGNDSNHSVQVVTIFQFITIYIKYTLYHSSVNVRHAICLSRMRETFFETITCAYIFYVKDVHNSINRIINFRTNFAYNLYKYTERTVSPRYLEI